MNLSACNLLTFALLVAGACPAADDSRALEAARRQASAALQTIAAAVAPSPGSDPERSSLGANLGRYAENPGDSARHESLVEAARRILAAGTTTRRAPDETSRALDAAADAILATVRAAEASTPPHARAQLEPTLVELRSRALIARFHARRMLAAVHYNLFKRGLRLAELVAATYGEKDAVAVWRELVAQAGAHPLAAQWRAELKLLEIDLKELEEQCCPPDEAILKEKVWQPVGAKPPRAE